MIVVHKNSPAGAFPSPNSHAIYGVGRKEIETIYSVPGASRCTPPLWWSRIAPSPRGIIPLGEGWDGVYQFVKFIKFIKFFKFFKFVKEDSPYD